VLVEAVRSGFVESRHRGHLLAAAPDGSPVLALGDVDAARLPRSANKPLQAIGLLELGWDPSDPQLALAVASHSGEPRHLEVVRRVLADAGLDEDALRCPPSLPLSEDAAHALLRSGGSASPLTMNCSGKHAGMLATCVVNGWPVDSYLDAGHPLQRALRATVERLAGERVAHVAVDGCGAPQHGLTLRGLARAYERVACAGPGTHERRTADAVRAHPELLGGTGRAVTTAVRAVPGLVAKDGAEGVYAAAAPGLGSIALKVEDGAERAAPVLLAAALRVLGAPSSPQLRALERPAVRGRGEVVGELRPTF
jgi:L-asparaginase II